MKPFGSENESITVVYVSPTYMRKLEGVDAMFSGSMPVTEKVAATDYIFEKVP